MHQVRLLAALLAALVIGALVPGAPSARADSLDPPVLDAPAEGDVMTHNPTFTWTPVPRASKYRIEVSATAAFASVVYDADVVGTSATPVTELPLGSLHWRVAAFDGAGKEMGAFSASRSFTRTQPAAPELIAPADGSRLSYPADPAVLSWKPVAGMARYVVQVDDEETFGGASSYTTAATAFALPPGLPFGIPRFWRVQGISTDPGVTTEWSDARELRDFTIAWPATARPAPVAPADSLTVAHDDHEFSWTPVPGAARYEIQTSNVENFANPLTTQVTGMTRYTPPATMSQDQYYWRVRALQSNGSPSGWSPVWRTKREWIDRDGMPARPAVRLPDADPLVPGAQLERDRIALSWTAVRRAAYYELDISTDPTFINEAPSVRRTCRTPNTEWTPYISGAYTGTSANGFAACSLPGTAAEPGRSYYVRVRAVDYTSERATRTTLWSNAAREGEGSAPATASFTVIAASRAGTDPAEPAVLDPSPDSVGTPKLSWRPVAGADAYLVALARDSSFNTRVLGPSGHVLTRNTELVLNHALLDNTVGQPYFWYVLPCERWVSASDNSCVAANKAINIPGKHASFNKLGKAVEGLTAAPVQGDTVALEWRDHLETAPEGGGVRWYELQVLDAAGAEVDSVDTDAVGYSPIDEDYPDGHYTWRVRAVDAAGTPLAWSAPAGFEKRSSAPELRQPARSDGSPVLRWMPTSFADSYDVEIYRGVDPAFPAGNKVTAAGAGATGRRYAEWVPTAALPADTYSWRVRQVDAYRNAGPWSTAILPFTVGADKPQLLAPAPDSSVPAPSLVFHWSAVAGAVRYRFESSSTPGFGTVVESVRTTGTAYAPTAVYAGGVTYYWRVSALNAAGEPLATTDPLRFTARTAPGAPVASAKVIDARIQVSWQKPNTGGSELTGHILRYRAEGATAWTELVTAGDVTSATFGELEPNRRYEAQVAARNAIGVGSFSARVSATTPSVPGAPASLILTPGTRGLSATWRAPSTAASALPVTSYVVRTTPAAGGESSETTVGGTSALLRDLADSTAYTVDVAARNAIGTGPFISAQATTLPPPPPPDTVIMAGPGDGSTIGGSSVTFGFYGVPAAFVASFECELDGGGYEACVSPLVLSDLGEGPHVLRVRAADDAGDADETPAERRFTVDVTAPDTVITSAPADGIATSATFAYAGVPAQDAERFECKLDSGPFMACPASGTSYPYLAPGSHTFSVRALDRASNADQTPASKTWTIRPVSVLTPSPPPAGTSGEVLPVPRSGGREADRRKLVRGLAALPGRARTGKDRRSIAFKLASGAFPAGTRLRFVLAVPAKAIGTPAGRTVTIGSAGATVRARTGTTVTIELTARARAALKRKRRLKARLTATATAPSTAKVTRTTDVVLR